MAGIGKRFGLPRAYLIALAAAPLILVTACVTYIPADEFNLARAAYEAARDADAARYAPALWFKAEQAYREGQKLFRERSYDNARAVFVQAKYYAEQAENAARIERHKSGDFVP